jgi:hypothetical protein
MSGALSISVPIILTSAVATRTIKKNCHHVSGGSFCNHVTDFCHQPMYFLLALSNSYAFHASKNSTNTFIAIALARCAPAHSYSLPGSSPVLCFTIRLGALQKTQLQPGLCISKVGYPWSSVRERTSEITAVRLMRWRYSLLLF